MIRDRAATPTPPPHKFCSRRGFCLFSFSRFQKKFKISFWREVSLSCEESETASSHEHVFVPNVKVMGKCPDDT